MKKILLPLAFAAITSSAFAEQVVVTSVNCESSSFQSFTSNYSNNWQLKNSKGEFWNVVNFNNNNGNFEGYIRTGSRTAAVVGSVTTDFVIEQAIDEIVVDVWRQKSGAKDILNKAAIYVADNAEFTDADVYEFTDKISADEFEQAVSVYITTPKKNQYYKVEFDCPRASNNGFVQFSGLTYYAQDGTSEPDLLPAELSYEWTEFEAVVGEEFVAPTLINPHNLIVSYSSSNEDVATVDANTGAVTIKNAGQVTITASSEENAVYLAGEASYVIAVSGASADNVKICEFNPLKENQQESVSSYDNSWKVKEGDYEWTVTNCNNNKNGWDYIRAGRKNVESVASVATDFAVPGTVESVTINLEMRSGGTPNSATVYVADNDAFTGAAEYTFTDELATGKIDVAITTPVENAYVKVEFDCPAGTANGFVQLNGIEYYGKASSSALLPSGLAYEETEFNATVGEEFTAPTLINPNGLKVTYTSSDENVATVAEDGAVTILAAGTTVITAASVANETFSAGSARYTINVTGSAANLAEFIENAPAKGDKLVLAGDVTVVYVNGAYNYIKDATASSLIYGNDLGLSKGDVIPGGWVGTVDIYSGLYEIKVDALPEVTATAEVEYPTVTNAEDLKMNEVVTLSKVEFAEATPSSKDNFSGVFGGETVAFRNTFEVEGVEAGTYDVLAAVSYYKDAIQVCPISYTENNGNGLSAIESDSDAAAFYTLQGVRVANPENGIFIRVAGGKASKVVVE